MSLIKGMQKKEDSEKGRKHNNNSKQFINVRQNKKLAKNKKYRYFFRVCPRLVVSVFVYLCIISPNNFFCILALN